MRVSWRFYGIFLPLFHGFFLLRKNSLNSVWDLHLNSSSFSKINPESNSSVPLRAGFMEFSYLFVPAENCIKPSSTLRQTFPHFQKLISIPFHFLEATNFSRTPKTLYIFQNLFAKEPISQTRQTTNPSHHHISTR